MEEREQFGTKTAPSGGRPIETALPELLRIVRELNQAYPIKKFTLDGRLVGDIGEILVQEHYDLKLYEGVRPKYDAITTDGRRVQIKATMKKALSFPVGEIPDNYLGILITPDGKFEEIFNGPGRIVHQCVERRKPTKNGLHMIGLGRLRKCAKTVPPEERIPSRARG